MLPPYGREPSLFAFWPFLEAWIIASLAGGLQPEVLLLPPLPVLPTFLKWGEYVWFLWSGD